MSKVLYNIDSNIKSNAIFNDDKKHRYLLERTWDDKKPKICVIMLHPSHADKENDDETSSMVVQYLKKYKNDFGGVYIVNQESRIDENLEEDEDIKIERKKENDSEIIKAIKSSKKIYIAFRSAKRERKKEILKMLKENNFKKAYYFTDENGKAIHLRTSKIVGEEKFKKLSYILKKNPSK
ncbi:DUF1643 domain-containing protein [Clostridioides difficile]|nr:DUF1643 domain-containing protein [Clostridioides difficile]